ncbi:minor capsid protein [Mechercharimyces sp. CAU 1602]|uniref:minor capsid protein n=1 Tax=Mechercharimyces sp. CAU 1602 TaxID=2973933 RepID=UPI002162FF29|nr:minor capsid protein [Mechercharimyces sp. CAU 1602]MCS1350321.1 minor capsid protein [Mechercharimyces sp. CAU 1602]
MRTLELINFIKGRVSYVYYPNRFPENSIDDCAIVRIYSGEGTDEWIGKRVPHFQVLVRGAETDAGGTEEKAYEIFESLVNQKHVDIGSDHIVQIVAMGSAPFFIGNDENSRPIYSMNFRAIVKPKIEKE